MTRFAKADFWPWLKRRWGAAPAGDKRWNDIDEQSYIGAAKLFNSEKLTGP